MASNPWGERPNEFQSLHSIMQQEGEDQDGRIASELHKKLNMASAQMDETVSPPSTADHSVESDEMLAIWLQEELNKDNTSTMNDAVLAAMLQNEIDSVNMAAENHRNGKAKVTVSSYAGVKQNVVQEMSEDEENSFFELSEISPDKSRTKHDVEMNCTQNHKKISDTFNLEFNTGDFTGITVPHKVYNELQVEAHKSKFNGIRVKDRRDVSTHEKVLDKKTRVVMLKMLNSGIVKKVNGIVSSGKESVIIHCNGGRIPGKGKDIPVPHECVFKIHKTTLNEFSRRRDYLDERYSGLLSNKTKHLIQVWALKEVHNLKRLRRAGVMCPEVVAHRKQLLLLSFIGCNGIPAQTLEEAVFSSDQLKSAFQQLLSGMKTMFSKCKLVHADLSGYNLLWYSGVLHFIDLSQAVLVDHPAALTYLYRDCVNMHKYFHTRNLKNLLDPKTMLCHVTEMDIKYTDEASFVTQIEHLQRHEIREFKHGTTTTDYAFETSFNETFVISSDSEEEEEEEEETVVEEPGTAPVLEMSHSLGDRLV